MKFKKLGTTDLDVSLICLGTMTWGEQNLKHEGFEQMDYALDKGVNFFDTADLSYTPIKKHSEYRRIIGNWFDKKKKKKIF